MFSRRPRIKKKNLIFGYAGSSLQCADFSPVAASWGYSLVVVVVHGLLIAVASPCESQALGPNGLQELWRVSPVQAQGEG